MDDSRMIMLGYSILQHIITLTVCNLILDAILNFSVCSQYREKNKINGLEFSGSVRRVGLYISRRAQLTILNFSVCSQYREKSKLDFSGSVIRVVLCISRRAQLPVLQRNSILCQHCNNLTSSPNLGGRLLVLPVFCFSLLTLDQTFAFTSYFQRSSLSARNHLQNTTTTQNSKTLLKTKHQTETVSSLGSHDDLSIFRARQYFLTVS